MTAGYYLELNVDGKVIFYFSGGFIKIYFL
jgi:hypothetical protein